ncbi:helix-turn-helix transcriptional regulator [Nodosilinea nodulosa]|uniref:helix-turn-helix transcriptional regulator n=1 Tax=Nodosilinea nodulosa TaxID=416001 RepID=UPI0002D28CD9|nr:AraC family transcriptional regulator [Nodosilinea nodulosa]
MTLSGKQRTEFARLWQPGAEGIELFSAQLYRYAFAKHMHEAYTIGLNHCGLGGCDYRGSDYQAYPGGFNLIHPGEVHTGHVQGNRGWGFRNLYISVPTMERILAQIDWPESTLPYFVSPTKVRADTLGSGIFSRVFAALNRPASRLEQDTLLLELVAYLVDRYADRRHSWRSPQPETQAVAIAQAYLKEHYAESISIAALADRVGLSPFYLIRSFRHQVGLPPHGYQRHWQLMQAKRSLHTSQPLADIAIAHGFYDQSHLTRTFKKAFGVTPGQYRQSNFVQDLPR